MGISFFKRLFKRDELLAQMSHRIHAQSLVIEQYKQELSKKNIEIKQLLSDKDELESEIQLLLEKHRVGGNKR